MMLQPGVILGKEDPLEQPFANTVGESALRVWQKTCCVKIFHLLVCCCAVWICVHNLCILYHQVYPYDSIYGDRYIDSIYWYISPPKFSIIMFYFHHLKGL